MAPESHPGAGAAAAGGLIAPDPGFRDRIRASFASQGMMRAIGARMISVEPGHVVLELPRSEAVLQQHGFFHGGAIGTLADVAGGYAGYTLIPADASALTVEYKINIMAPGRGTRLVAEGRVVRAGRTLIVTTVDVTAHDGAGDQRPVLVATMLQTLMRLDRPDTLQVPLPTPAA